MKDSPEVDRDPSVFHGHDLPYRFHSFRHITLSPDRLYGNRRVGGDKKLKKSGIVFRTQERLRFFSQKHSQSTEF